MTDAAEQIADPDYRPRRRAGDLESRLTEWGRDYGGGKYGLRDNPHTWLSNLIRWGGRSPTGSRFVGCTAADDVQLAVDALAKQADGWLPAQVVRCEYLLPGQPLESKLQKLRSLGENLSRSRYYGHLRVARIHVAAWLRIPFSDIVSRVEL